MHQGRRCFLPPAVESRGPAVICPFARPCRGLASCRGASGLYSRKRRAFRGLFDLTFWRAVPCPPYRFLCCAPWDAAGWAQAAGLRRGALRAGGYPYRPRGRGGSKPAALCMLAVRLCGAPPPCCQGGRAPCPAPLGLRTACAALRALCSSPGACCARPTSFPP